MLGFSVPCLASVSHAWLQCPMLGFSVPCMASVSHAWLQCPMHGSVSHAWLQCPMLGFSVPCMHGSVASGRWCIISHLPRSLSACASGFTYKKRLILDKVVFSLTSITSENHRDEYLIVIWQSVRHFIPRNIETTSCIVISGSLLFH